MAELKMKTEILILGLDGLEHDYVCGEYLPNIKQVEYGKLKVPITEIDEASTPIIWTSFVTGKQPHEHGIVVPSVYNSKLVTLIDTTVTKIIGESAKRKCFMFLTPLIKILRRFDAFQIHSPRKEDIKVPTMFDVVPSSVSVSVPVLNVDVNKRYAGFVDAILDPVKRVRFIEFLMHDFEQDKKELFSVLNKYRLVMCHFQITDLYGHIYCKDREQILSLYRTIDDFVGDVIKKTSRECWILIISDHGIDEDFGHTKHGFYSSNININLNDPHITDFYPMIMDRMTVCKIRSEGSVKNEGNSIV